MKRPVQLPLSWVEELKKQEARFEQRFDHVVAQFHQARADYEAMLLDRQATRAMLAATRAIVITKQEIIVKLLPYYPYPITPELQRGIDLH